jgi:hypothetical protein
MKKRSILSTFAIVRRGMKRVSNGKTYRVRTPDLCIYAISSTQKDSQTSDHPALLGSHNGRHTSVHAARAAGRGSGGPVDGPRYTLVGANVLWAPCALNCWRNGVSPAAGAAETLSSTGEPAGDAVIVLAAAPAVVADGCVQGEGWCLMSNSRQRLVGFLRRPSRRAALRFILTHHDLNHPC